MLIAKYIHMVHKSEVDLCEAFALVAKDHADEVDIVQLCTLLSSWSASLASQIEPFVNIYGEQKDSEPDRLSKTLMKSTRSGSFAPLRDLHDLYLIATEVSMSCIILKQGALGLKDKSLMHVCDTIETQTKRQTSWLQTRIKSATPQTLITQE